MYRKNQHKIMCELMEELSSIWARYKYGRAPNKFVALFRGNSFSVIDDSRPIYYISRTVTKKTKLEIMYVVDSKYCKEDSENDRIWHIDDRGAVRPISCVTAQSFVPKGTLLRELNGVLMGQCVK